MAETGAEARPRRLIITEMVLENFKSYAGEQRVGPFHKCFSSVVGPNGSGKSNVIDAMLFVFGKRAKQLRLNKVSELIHNSAGRQNIEQAQVSVYFQEIIDLLVKTEAGKMMINYGHFVQDDESYEAIPGTDFVVSRTAHRNNKSDYFINGRKSNFTEVTHLLKGKGIDLDHNRFLILQGEVEQISMMKPKAQTEHETGLLEYLEDIIGTNRFIAPLQESAKRLEEFGEARAGLVARVKIAEKEREALEADKLAAEAYLDKEREARSNNRLLAHTFAHLAQKNVEKIEANMSKREEKLAHEKNKSGDYKSTLEEHETRFEAASKAHAMMVRELESVTERFREYERKDIAFREELKHCRNKLTKGAEREQRERVKLETAKAEAAKGTEKVPELRAAATRSASQLEREESKLEAALEACSDEAARIRDHLGSARAELAPYESRAAACKASRDEAASERDLLVREREAAQRELEKARRVLAEAEQEVAAQEAKEKELVANERQATARLEAAKHSLHEARQSLSRCEEALRHARGRLAQRRSERSGAQSASAVANALQEARQSKSIPGILGRLGDLGAIDAKYDIAVSSAAPALDNWVVDSTATAQRCVELLRQRALGVATFLILERQRHLVSHASAAPPQTPEGVPRLFDLVQIKGSGEDADAARLAFYFALRDTLVTTDLEQATRIAYAPDNRRWRRLVTLNGETVNEAGTLSGGGSKPKGGRMLIGKLSSSARGTGRNAAVMDDNDVNNEDDTSLELSAREAETAHRAAQQAFTATEREVDEATVECKNFAAELPRCRLRIKGARERYSDALARLSSMESDVAAKKKKGQKSDDSARERRIEELTRIIDASETELNAIAKESVRAAAAVQAIEQELETLGGEPVRRLRAAIATLGADIDSKEAEAARLEAAGAAAAKQVQKLERELERAARELESVREKQEKVKHEFKELEEAAFKVLESVNATRALMEAKAQELEAIKVEYEKKQKEYAIICQVEEEIKSQLDAQKSLLREEAAKQRHWRGKAEKADKALLEVLSSYAKVAAEESNQNVGKVMTTADDGSNTNMETADTTGVSTDDHPASNNDDDHPNNNTTTLKPLRGEELDQVDTEALQYRLTMLQEEMQRMTVNLGAIDAWRAKDAEYAARVRELEQATAARDEIRRAHDDLRKQRLDGFMAGFNSISLRLKEMYQMITLGGDAELELVDSLDPFSEGILFSVRPPKKSWKNIANLSGGEKTLSSLSLVFALHHYKPTPLYVMDEIDAALDFKNVSIVGHYIKERTKNAQFVIISLRNNMFELADRLVGIYKTDNATKSVAIDPGAFVVGGVQQRRLIAAA